MNVTTLNEIPPWDWPEDARGVLLQTLRDGERDAADRPLAAQLAGNMVVIDDRLAELLLGLIADGDELAEVRAAAAIALGPVLEQGYVDGFDDPEDVPISEKAFHAIQDAMREAYLDGSIPKEVRRRVLEGAVRAPRKWLTEVVRTAYAGNDPDWQLTAVFCMEHLDGFKGQILEALGSDNDAIHYHAVIASGNWGLDEAWHHVAGLLAAPSTDKSLLFAAIEAATGIRPEEAEGLLADLLDSEDEDIVDAAQDAIAMAAALTGLDIDEAEDDPEDW